MKNRMRLISRSVLGGAMLLALGSGCDTDVVNPGIIDAEAFDPGADAATLSLSAQTRFWSGYTNLVLWSARFSGELWTGDARIETNDVARRVVNETSLDVAPAWNNIQSGLAANELAIDVLEGGANAASDLNLARAYMNAGFSLVLLGETACQGVILSGPPLTTAQTLDSAIVRFQKAITIAGAVTGTGAAEATRVRDGSNVGLARAHLQKKDYAAAAAAAALVPAAFVYNAVRIDDAAQRGLGNQVYNLGVLGTTLVVPDAYRALNDPRVTFQDANRLATDGILRLYRPTKYAGWASPIRIASGLEASYIVAESRLMTGDAAPALALIAARRTAGSQPAFTGAGSGQAAILAELMDQRARDFWLEGKKLGDLRRNPSAVPYVGATGAAFFKPSQGNYGTATCFPVPIGEVNANPNFPRG